ncbi:MAG: Mth938-like domain-containing protein [Rhodospirillaceae bacterium]
MKLTRHTPSDVPFVQRYGRGGFRISGMDFASSVLILPRGTETWPVMAHEELTVDALAPLIAVADTLDVCLLGCGARMRPLGRELRLALKDAGVAMDPMDTGSACRTYNVLVSEGRAVAAALIAF